MKIEKTFKDIDLRRETTKSRHRPLVRRLLDLTNEELALLLKLRADKLSEKLAKHNWNDGPHMVYWSEFIPLQAKLYECLLEVQSRYPVVEVDGYSALLPMAEVTLSGFKELRFDENGKIVKDEWLL